jgi:hypothetical protein
MLPLVATLKPVHCPTASGSHGTQSCGCVSSWIACALQYVAEVCWNGENPPSPLDGYKAPLRVVAVVATSGPTGVLRGTGDSFTVSSNRSRVSRCRTRCGGLITRHASLLGPMQHGSSALTLRHCVVVFLCSAGIGPLRQFPCPSMAYLGQKANGRFYSVLPRCPTHSRRM